MAFEKITENVENISLLPDSPALTPSELKNEFDRAGKLIKEKFNKLIDELNNNMYPIGTGFIAYDDTDYTNHLGFKWERTLVGKTPVGKNPDEEEFNTIGKTGGEKTHKLTQTEMPKHIHKYNETRYKGQNLWGMPVYQYQWDTNTIINSSTSESGGDMPHNNLQPYQVVNFWRRIA